MARAHIGTSGWSYDAWKDGFYEGVPRRAWLEHCAARFTSLEANATHYRLQSESTLCGWREQTPDDFRFAIKGHKFVTHNKNLADPTDTIPRSHDNARPLGDALAAVVWQLPARFKKNLDRLADFARTLAREWGEADHAIEFRHATWFDDEVAACMREHNLGVCQSDAASWPFWGAVTADFVYIRLHGHEYTYASAYTDGQLDWWAERIDGWLGEGRDVYAYFDNDAHGHAPYDAMRLLERVGR